MSLVHDRRRTLIYYHNFLRQLDLFYTRNSVGLRGMNVRSDILGIKFIFIVVRGIVIARKKKKEKERGRENSSII